MRLYRPLVVATALALAATACATRGAGTTPSPSPRDGERSTMERIGRAMERDELERRRATLDALTPAHRAAIGTIVGDLAVARRPDVAAASRSVDAMLSAHERLAILEVERSELASVMRLMTIIGGPLGAVFGKGGNASPPPSPGPRSREPAPAPKASIDPGWFVLQELSAGIKEVKEAGEHGETMKPR